MHPLFHYFSPEFHQGDLQSLWQDMCDHYTADEKLMVSELQQLVPDTPDAAALAAQWLQTQRETPCARFDLHQLISQFSINSDEGLALISMAEALLRIPDAETAYALVEDKLDSADWEQALTNNESTLLNTSIWGIALGQHLVRQDSNPSGLYTSVRRRLGRPAMLKVMKTIMRSLSDNFVFAETIKAACDRRYDYDSSLNQFSFDILGEAAVSESDVEHYFATYLNAIETVGQRKDAVDTTISIKLSALHPRFENLKNRRVYQELTDRLLQLIVAARTADVGIILDAEEADRLELSLNVFKELLRTDLAIGWGKLGLAVQAYSKRALPTLGWLEHLGRELDTPIPIRLVKGACWDAEIKLAQQLGLKDYPVYTLKASTDIAYLVCARFLLSEQCRTLLPEFATHNALTAAQLLGIPSQKPIKFQRLHGMADGLYQQISHERQRPCRIYAPVGDHRELLPYLVRRLLENGANSAFIFKANNRNIPISTLLKSPLERLHQTSALRNPRIPLPANVFASNRKNSQGFNYGSSQELLDLRNRLNHFENAVWHGMPIISGEKQPGMESVAVYSPQDIEQQIGTLDIAAPEQIKRAYADASTAWPAWRDTPVAERSAVLLRYAELLEAHRNELIYLCMSEAGKTLRDAIDEIRRAVDFCYYYAAQAEKQLNSRTLISVTGESNELQLKGRGIFLCISPWNSPLAIFSGQIAAALVSGNAVIAKPSSKSSLIAMRATELWLEAGLPMEILQLIPFSGTEQSEQLLQDYRLAGIAFTGSCATANGIFATLAQRLGAPLPVMIAETGGLNAMIADSTSLPEQIVKDAVRSAFASAGQSCSALRVLYLQEEIADAVTDQLIGATKELKLGDPRRFDVDIGPIIDQEAMDTLYNHIELARAQGRLMFELQTGPKHDPGYFVPPTIIRLHTMDELTEEIFGPILHIVRYPAERLDQVIEEINRSGYGLTLGIHSRNSQTIRHITEQAQVGNIYVNRDQVGAVVGAQPFGGMNLSGTGPKAGGPFYLHSFVQEKTITQNTTACGGDRQLLMDAEGG
ncbi:bifunctional proline dehydrogenase/L-glutamate gamma-semialdehyde dehydrogenase PutA [Pontibacterium granulatum]|uniref:bifunctional proline dehydrogenase/L-glutamate gamma-semialdehyde dehydrogenase PutA n=1 Tax=Pontibacterium granulatum TaxID=2036029 RepID=UPI00249ADE7C|nr:bifunctional proline dehydrogenase/L-glutamate gamma-semialdehyde dehydrogenase PutA [Pontibacterium granulatum]MDI3324424.1 bifunctional proline dehydrogenase/L-glutamate gamma-semialdehyde dehydrogenase PutA [Pontibacterium granulatum]